jgi:hypothetical protein
MDRLINILAYFGHAVFWLALMGTIIYFEDLTWTGIGISFVSFMIYLFFLKILDYFNGYGW